MKNINTWIQTTYTSLLIAGCLFVSKVYGYGIDDFKEFPIETPEGTSANPDLGQDAKNILVDGEESIIRQIIEAFGLDFINETDQPATYYIKELVNWALAVIGLVAVGVLLYGFYRMLFTDKHEDEYANARKRVINAAIAIAVVGTAYFITSWFFKIYEIARDSI